MFYLINKEKKWTSFDVCAFLRKRLKIKKIGHTGTLDPFATGLLIVGAGKCTRLIPFLEKNKKTYQAIIMLGKTSETLDPESAIQESFTGKIPTIAEIKNLISTEYFGKILQIPPKYSALKVNGKKLCDLARQGKTIEIKARQTEIMKIEILSYDFPILELLLETAAGFYVRSLARDLGEKLCGGGLCLELKRTNIENLSLSKARNVDSDELVGLDPQIILPHLPQLEINDREDDFLAGRAFPNNNLNNIIDNSSILIMKNNTTIGIGEKHYDMLQPKIVF